MTGYIIEGCATFIEFLGAIHFLEDKVNKENRKQYLFLILPIVILVVWSNTSTIVSLNAIILYFIYCFFYIFLFYKDFWLEKLLMSTIYFFLIIICDYFCATIYGLVLNEANYMDILSVMGSYHRTLFLIIDKISLIFVSYAIRVFILEFVPLNKIQYFVAMGVIGTVLVYVTYNFSNMLALLGWSIYIFFAIIFMAMFGLYTKWKESEESKEYSNKKNESYIKYYNTLLSLQNEKDRLIHDIKYQYTHMIQMLDEGKYNECRQYLTQIAGVLESNQYVQYTGNTYIDFILNHKSHEAEQKGINFIINADYMGKVNELNQQDINIIFGNLLDNSIEAAVLLDENERWIKLELSKIHHMIFITIRNSSKDKPLILNGHIRTSKNNISRVYGIGLKNVEQIVLKYDGIFEISYEQNVFTVEATLFL